MDQNTPENLMKMLISSSRDRKKRLIGEFEQKFGLAAEAIRDKKHPSHITCPHCGAEDNRKAKKDRHIIAYGFLDQDKTQQRFYCKECEHHFNDLTNTLFHHKKLRKHILPFLERMLNGISIRKTAADLGVSPATINSWRQAVLRYIEKNLHLVQAEQLSTDITETSTREFKPSRKGVPNHCTIPKTTQVIQFHCDRQNHWRVSFSVAGILKSRKQMIKGESLVLVNGASAPHRLASPADRILLHTRNVRQLDNEFAAMYRRMRGVAQPNLLKYALWQCLLMQLNRLNTKEKIHALLFLCL